MNIRLEDVVTAIITAVVARLLLRQLLEYFTDIQILQALNDSTGQFVLLVIVVFLGYLAYWRGSGASFAGREPRYSKTCHRGGSRTVLMADSKRRNSVSNGRSSTAVERSRETGMPTLKIRAVRSAIQS